MRSVSSRDGTKVAVQTSGEGPPLVAVHGTSSSAARWAPVLPALGRHFTVHVVERRGRGESVDRADYALEREVEDIVAVIDDVGSTTVNLLGHSFGGLIALEAARVSKLVEKLIVYEPAVAVEGRLYPVGSLERFEQKLAAGDREGVVTSFFTDVLQFDEAGLARTRGLASWPGRVAAAHTIPREVKATDGYLWDPVRFSNLEIPARVFVGGESGPFARRILEAVAAALPMGELVVLAGQKHVAMDTAPELFVREVVAFFSARA